jgi:DNA-binding NarL/FixJ family response regulator
MGRRERTLSTTVENLLHTEEEEEEEVEPKPFLGTVLLECDYPVVAMGLKEILKEEAEVYEGRKAQGAQDPSCVILCPNGKDVASEVRRLRFLNPDAALLVFDTRVDQRLAKIALRAGASGFIHGGMRPEQLVRAIQRASSVGKAVISEELLEVLMTEESKTEHLRVLTPRQREILELVVEGLSNARIAERLFLTESTIKQHLRAAYKLLNVHNRTEAAKLLRGS